MARAQGSFELQVVTLVNQERTAAGKPTLIAEERLFNAAEGHARWMADNDTLSHYEPPPSNPLYDAGDRAVGAGYTPSSWGETLAAGHTTPELVVLGYPCINDNECYITACIDNRCDGWKQSPDHWPILMGTFRDIGVGYIYDASTTYDNWWAATVGNSLSPPTPFGTQSATPSYTGTPTPTGSPTSTSTQLPTATDTSTPVPTATDTSTPLPTATDTSTLVPTAADTSTPAPTATDTSTIASTATDTSTPAPTPTDTSTSVPTATDTWTPVPTTTDTSTLVPTATDTSTLVPTVTVTSTSLPTATDTTTPASPTETYTSTPVPTKTPTTTSQPTATVEPTPLPPTATHTMTPDPTATDTPTAPGVEPDDPAICEFLENRVPPVVIFYAVANPGRIQGYGQLCYPNRPESPYNTYRRYLSLWQSSKPYHPLYNGVVFKCGCP